MVVRPSGEDLALIARLLEQRRCVPLIDSEWCAVPPPPPPRLETILVAIRDGGSAAGQRRRRRAAR